MKIHQIVITLLSCAFGALAVGFIACILELTADQSVLLASVYAAFTAFQPRSLGSVELFDNLRLSALAAIVAAGFYIVSALKPHELATLSFFASSLLTQVLAFKIEIRRRTGQR